MDGHTLSIDFTAVVPSYNEADILPRCLESLDFCRELIVVDQGSTDGSVEVARKYGARILSHELHDYPNLARQYGIKQAGNEWVVSIDPDEVFPKEDINKIEQIILTRPDLAAVRIPWQFYFRGEPLNCTVWGAPNRTKSAVVHRDRVKGTPHVHKEFSFDQNIYYFSRSEIAPIQHFWINSYQELSVRLRRYAIHEGESKYQTGQRFSWFYLFKFTTASLYNNLVKYKGFIGGLTGIFLSCYHAWYVLISWLSLRQYESRRSTGH